MTSLISILKTSSKRLFQLPKGNSCDIRGASCGRDTHLQYVGLLKKDGMEEETDVFALY